MADEIRWREKNPDKELVDPEGYGAIEYAYSKMAKDAGVSMMPCRLFEENGRLHFMTKRFDRTDDGVKLHMQSLAVMAHYDFNMAGAYGYEQAIMTIKQLGLGMPMKWVSITITAPHGSPLRMNETPGIQNHHGL